MSSNNGGGEFLSVLLILVFFAALIALAVAAMVSFAVAVTVFFAFIAFCWTFVCMLAWRRPFRLGKIFLHTDEARAFVYRGIFGAVMVPAFLLTCDIFLVEIDIHWRYLGYFVLGGYTLLSTGLEYLFARRRDIPYVYHDLPRHYQEALPPPRQPRQELLPPPPKQPRFASWDDEEER